MKIVIILLTYFIAFDGILFDPKKDHNKPISFRNLNRFGKILLSLLTLLTILTIWQLIRDDKQQSKEAKENRQKVQELSEYNRYILKAIAVNKGYDVTVQGHIYFSNPVDDSWIRKSLSNMFVKGAEVKILTKNKYGKFSALISYSNEPEIRKFWNTNRESKNVGKSKENNFFFELRFSGIKILSEDKIPYVRMDSADSFEFSAYKQDIYDIYKNIYHVSLLVFYQVGIEELGIKTVF